MKLRRAACAAALAAGTAFAGVQSLYSPVGAAQGSPRTTIFLHGRFYTNDPARPWAAAMPVRDDKIVCIGALDYILMECSGDQENTATVQLHGNFAMPGFNDAHVHLGEAGAETRFVHLNGASSVEELQKRLHDAVAQHKEGEWVVGSGWDHTLWPERKFPNRSQLDVAAPHNPVFLTHISGHVAVANSAALRLAGIDKNTANPSGGNIERDADHEPTGMLQEGSAMALVERKIPEATPEQRRQGIELVLAEAGKNGVTSVQDNSGWEDFQVYQQLNEEGNLTVRITEWLPFSAALADLQNMRSQGGTTDPWRKPGALKMVTDGALGSRTAAMLAPYSDAPGTSGIMTMEPAKLRAMALERDKAGFQLAFHAIGDKANRIALDVFEAVAQANGPRDRRSRIEHAQVVATEDFARFGQLGVIASMQPSHETTDMRWAGLRVGPERSKGAYAWASMQKNGVRLAFGTDYPVEVVSPFRGLYACVTRELPEGGPAGGWQPQEKISLEDCIRAYTSGSAYAQFEDGKKGELKAGEYADFIVLSDDLTKIPPAQYTKTHVLRTVVAGHTVFQEK